MGFNDMKKNKGVNSSLLEELNKISSGSTKSYQDDRFWKPERDKADNGFAVIRFLPPVEGEDVPFVRIFNHGFKGPGGWMIENCPTTIGLKCPVCEANSELWNSGMESDKDIARNRKRKLQYIANIMVVSDPKNPQNEGKTFLYKFGKKIFDKIQEKAQPEFEDEEAMDPFDFWKGANFKIKIRKVGGFVNYDKSEFDSSSALLDGDDAELETLWKKQYPLQQFIAPDQFKNYNELSTRLGTVLGSGGGFAKTAEDVNGFNQTSTETSTGESSTSVEAPAESGGGGEGDALSYFEKLAAED
jgi:hypothetical protein